MPYLAGFVTPQDYGAGGSGSTDDTAAINSALAAGAANGSMTLFPSGSYKITSTITAPITGTQIVGSGWGSQILYDGSVVNTAFAASGNIRFCMRDLRISQTNSSHLGTALDISQCNSSSFERLLIDGGGASGVAPLHGIVLNASTCHYNTLRDLAVHYGGASSTGVSISGGAHSNALHNVHCLPQGDDAASSGIYITSAHSTAMFHPDVESGAGNGIFLDTAAHGTRIYGGYLDTNNINLKLSSGVIAPVFQGTAEGGVTANIQDNGSISPWIVNAWPNSGTNSYSSVALTNAAGYSINGVQIPGNAYLPPDLGYLAWAFDQISATNSTLTVSGTQYLAKLKLRYATTITNLHVDIATAASGVVANQNFLTLFDSTGAVRGQTAAGAIDTKLTATGTLSQAMVSPYAAPAGDYWVGFVNNATTPATLARAIGSSAGNGLLTASQYRYAVNGTGITSAPGAITPSSNTQTGAFSMWSAAS